MSYPRFKGGQTSKKPRTNYYVSTTPLKQVIDVDETDVDDVADVGQVGGGGGGSTIVMGITQDGPASQSDIPLKVLNFTSAPIQFIAVLSVAGKQYEGPPYTVVANGELIFNAADRLTGTLPPSGTVSIILIDLANQANTSDIISVTYGSLGNAVVGAIIILGILGVAGYVAFRLFVRR